MVVVTFDKYVEVTSSAVVVVADVPPLLLAGVVAAVVVVPINSEATSVPGKVEGGVTAGDANEDDAPVDEGEGAKVVVVAGTVVSATLLLLLAAPYCDAHSVTRKHPSEASQLPKAIPPGQGFLCKQSDTMLDSVSPQKYSLSCGLVYIMLLVVVEIASTMSAVVVVAVVTLAGVDIMVSS